jgi:hypothetical protein
MYEEGKKDIKVMRSKRKSKTFKPENPLDHEWHNHERRKLKDTWIDQPMKELQMDSDHFVDFKG